MLDHQAVPQPREWDLQPQVVLSAIGVRQLPGFDVSSAHLAFDHVCRKGRRHVERQLHRIRRPLDPPALCLFRRSFFGACYVLPLLFWHLHLWLDSACYRSIAQETRDIGATRGGSDALRLNPEPAIEAELDLRMRYRELGENGFAHRMLVCLRSGERRAFRGYADLEWQLSVEREYFDVGD